MLSVVLKMVVSYKHYNKDSETTEGITECSGMICLEEEQYILYKYSAPQKESRFWNFLHFGP